jgi:hypothetical protein
MSGRMPTYFTAFTAVPSLLSPMHMFDREIIYKNREPVNKKLM